MKPRGLSLPKEWVGSLAGRLAVVIGNGPSRVEVPQLQRARERGAVLFGCNAIWRLLEVDYLAVVDERYQKVLAALAPSERPGSTLLAFGHVCNPKLGLTLIGDRRQYERVNGSGSAALATALVMGAEVVATGFDGEGPSTFYHEDKARREPGYVVPGAPWHQKTAGFMLGWVRAYPGQFLGHIGPSKVFGEPGLEVSVLDEKTLPGGTEKSPGRVGGSGEA